MMEKKKLNSFSQLAPVGKRTFNFLINLAQGENEPKTTFEWLVDKNIIPGSRYDQRRVQQIIHYWKTTSGEIFQNDTNSNHNQIKEFKSPELRHSPNTKFLQSSLLNVPSVHEGKSHSNVNFALHTILKDDEESKSIRSFFSKLR